MTLTKYILALTFLYSAISVYGKSNSTKDTITISNDKILYNKTSIAKISDIEEFTFEKTAEKLNTAIKNFYSKSNRHIILKYTNSSPSGIFFLLKKVLTNLKYKTITIDQATLNLQDNKSINSNSLSLLINNRAITFKVSNQFEPSQFYITHSQKDSSYKYFLTLPNNQIYLTQLHTVSGKIIVNKNYKTVYSVNNGDNIFYYPDFKTVHTVNKNAGVLNPYRDRKVSLLDALSIKLKEIKIRYPQLTNVNLTVDKNIEFSLFMKISDIVSNFNFTQEWSILKGKKSTQKRTISTHKLRSISNIFSVIKKNSQNLRYKYHDHIKEKPNLKGKVLAKITIHKSGKVTSCKILKSSLKDRKFEHIIKKEILTWEFFKIRNGLEQTEIKYPFTFSQ